jgi:hypothetical protein
MTGPIRRFDPGELTGSGEPEPSVAELAEALAVARDLESLPAEPGVRPTAGFEDRVMAAVATEPAPRLVIRPGSAVRGGRAGALLLAIRESWAVATRGGRPMVVRAQALAFVLLAVLAAGSVTGLGAMTVGALLGRGPLPGPTIEPGPSVDPSAAPSGLPTASPSPSGMPPSTSPGASLDVARPACSGAKSEVVERNASTTPSFSSGSLEQVAYTSRPPVATRSAACWSIVSSAAASEVRSRSCRRQRMSGSRRSVPRPEHGASTSTQSKVEVKGSGCSRSA